VRRDVARTPVTRLVAMSIFRDVGHAGIGFSEVDRRVREDFGSVGEITVRRALRFLLAEGFLEKVGDNVHTRYFRSRRAHRAEAPEMLLEKRLGL
jgi:Fe2+ or Zn2+ uptake regulation protein